MAKKKIDIRRMRLTPEEKQIEEELIRGEWRPAPPEIAEKMMQALERARKDAILHIRINRQDLESLKKKARSRGVPYQTFIAKILHRYAL